MAAKASLLVSFTEGGLFQGFISVHFSTGNFPGQRVHQQAILAHEQHAISIGDDDADPLAMLADEDCFRVVRKFHGNTINVEVGVFVLAEARSDPAMDGSRRGVHGKRVGVCAGG